MGEFEAIDDDFPTEYDWDSPSDVPPTDELFRVLSHGRRRRILWFLLERPETTVEEIADVLIGWRVTDGEAVGPEDYRAVLASLYHQHLPILADSALLAYDSETGAVRFRSPPPPVEVLIKFSHQYERVVDDRSVR